MTYSVLYEKIHEPTFEGEYYAYIPAFDLMTQGMGIDGARAAAEDLLSAWIRSKIEDGEDIPPSDDAVFDKIVIPNSLVTHTLQTV
jgi:predicted RNase H-like HicB family nuclease